VTRCILLVVLCEYISDARTYECYIQIIVFTTVCVFVRLGACVCLFPICFCSHHLSTPSSIVVTVCTSCFNIKNVYILSKECIHVLRTILGTNIDFTYEHH